MDHTIPNHLLFNEVDMKQPGPCVYPLSTTQGNLHKAQILREKNNVVFTLPGDAVGAYRTFKLKSEAQREAAVKHALTKYPNAVIL